MEDHIDDSARRGNIHPQMDRTNMDSDSSTNVANSDEDNTAGHSQSSDATVIFFSCKFFCSCTYLIILLSNNSFQPLFKGIRKFNPLYFCSLLVLTLAHAHTQHTFFQLGM